MARKYQTLFHWLRRQGMPPQAAHEVEQMFDVLQPGGVCSGLMMELIEADEAALKMLEQKRFVGSFDDHGQLFMWDREAPGGGEEVG